MIDELINYRQQELFISECRPIGHMFAEGGPPMSQTTKRALAASLKNLLLQKPLPKITINDIAEECGIILMTF